MCGSPLSSETTALHTVAKLELGSSVNDRSPWFDLEPSQAARKCSHAYPQVWTGRSSSRHKLPATARDIDAPDSQDRLSAELADPPPSLRCRAPFRSETALPEANSFLCGCQPFYNIREVFFETVWTSSAKVVAVGMFADGFVPVERSLTGRTAVSTLKQSPERWRYGCDPSE